MPDKLTWSTHDDLPRDDARVVDTGLGEFNEQAAPLSGVRPLACFARDARGAVVGGAVGRTWGTCCELQQLWVAVEHRRMGLATRLVAMFEARAIERGCRLFYLDTFTFQAPAFYRQLGYASTHELHGFPDGIVKHLMTKRIAR
jgi:GNAT superfamily N-acetyltransferase